MPDQDRLPEVHVTNVGIARASGSAGARNGTWLLCGGREHFPRLVDDLEGGVSLTEGGLK